jgi:hypothetical protein
MFLFAVGAPVSIEESEGNSLDGFHPIETTYYITGANGEPLKVCLAIPNSTNSKALTNLVLPTSSSTPPTTNVSTNFIGQVQQQQQNNTATTSMTSSTSSTTTDVVASRFDFS